MNITELRDRFCNGSKCPICSNEVTIDYKLYFRIVCPNRCIYISLKKRVMSIVDDKVSSEDFYTISIFGEKCSNEVFVEIDKTIVKNVQDKIKYWKENDRYLAKILSK
ncbi:gp35 [Bacillus phage G]|uniref:Gp35 n=1 Tax=Bacillus phage G TaxID=2884420 RepID=G3MBA5_9CAUD|nr:gp35 [Bacillus phage G]AEO93306.1 gp35 [Bacillus phage G]